ncbi:MAG: hypothetical protein KGH98_05120 [Candidatus Micrarchaeota archaeon]|nr:hypothetical protein [Candidatus Micrarchaeota archaeon]
MTCVNITIRGLQEVVFRKFKSKAAEEDMKLGEALTQAMEMWVKEDEKRRRPKFRGMPKFDWGEGTENSSQEIDRILYG